jgi:hypothetical protein
LDPEAAAETVQAVGGEWLHLAADAAGILETRSHGLTTLVESA